MVLVLILVHFFHFQVIGLLTNIANASHQKIYIPLNNQQCMSYPTFINLHANEYIQGMRYYPFAVNLDRYMGRCNTLNELSNRICVPNKTENLNLIVFNLATG